MRDLNEPSSMNQAAFEAMIRRYMLKAGARYMPVIIGIAAVALILAFVPTKQPNNGFPTAAGNVGVGTGATTGTAGQAAGGAGQAAGASTAAAGGGPTVGSSSGGAAASTAAGRSTGAAAVAGGPVSSGSGAITPAATTGVSKTGIRCGPGVRQFTWSAYAPLCVPAYHGNNGGATALGVTGSTITLTYRLANSAQQTAIDSLAGAANINQNALVQDLQSYINYFNTQFELYGRHVVLKTYQGQGDYIEEDQGQDLSATQADAVTVHDMGAFGDVTFSLEASQPYEEDLAAEHVIGFSSIGLSQQWFEQHAPYEYSVQGPTGTNGITAAADVVCRRMAGMPAIYSGETLMQHTNRVFGIIYPQTPVYAAEVAQWKQMMQSMCHVTIPSGATIGYSINVAEYEQEAATAMAQMNADHVTTILCACDPIADIFLSDAADQQQYYPEWFASYFGDPIGRNYDQKEWTHVMTAGWQWPDYQTVEPYKVFERAYPGKQPAETPPTSPRYYYVPYYTLMQIFDALQAAGPDLNPYTFEKGMFSLPRSDPGDFIGGQWTFGSNVFDPISSYTLAWWSQTAVSKFDNTAGAYQWCNGGQTYYLDDPAGLGGPGQQLQCFGH